MDTTAVLRLIQDVADEVINPRFRALTSGQVSEKNPGDLVTVADQEAEVLLTAALTAAYPKAVVLGEEAHAADPGLMTTYLQADHAFTVDPVDGTKNFVNGSPDHAVMVSESRGGVVVRAWIWQPQHKASYVAELGAGAWRNGEPMVRTAPAAYPNWRGVTSRRSAIGRELGKLPPLELTWISCGIDYPHLADGDADFVLYGGTQPWDHAPGSLLLSEVGGFLGTGSGEEYGPRSVVTGGLIAARSREIYDAVLNLI